MDNYKIRLTPVDTFFFGGEKHDTELKANYYVESNPYPQQTTLMGFLRYYILYKNNCLSPFVATANKDLANELIGPSSFDYSAISPQSYGRVQEISPLYFEFNGEPYFPAPFDFKLFVSDDYLLSKIPNPKEDDDYYKGKDYDKYMFAKLTNNLGDKAVKLVGEQKEDCVMFKSPQIGNEKKEGGGTDDNAFYKQVMMQLKPNWSFCVNINLEGAHNISEGTTDYLPFGGEKSLFRVEVLAAEDLNFSLPSFKRNLPFLLCASDCFVNADILKNAVFAVNDFVSFRNLESSVNSTTNYSALSKVRAGSLKRSARYNLLKRGSILYFADNNELDKAIGVLTTNSNLSKIGFNQFIKKYKN